METVEDIINYVSEWRNRNSYTTYSDGTLNEESVFKLFASKSDKTTLSSEYEVAYQKPQIEKTYSSNKNCS